MTIQSYRDLEIWQRARTLAADIYRITQTFPPTERYGLVSQMRRAAISVPSNIAEGWARRYPAEFIQFLRTANGSLAELETQLILSADLGFINPQALSQLQATTDILARQILTLERKIKTKNRIQ